MPTIVGDVKTQILDDRVRYSMDWSALLGPDVSAYPATSRERITASNWTVPTDSPSNNVTSSMAKLSSEKMRKNL